MLSYPTPPLHRRSVADRYTFSRFHDNVGLGDLPAVRHIKGTDAVVMDHNALGGNTVLLFRLIYVDVVDELPHHALGDLGGVGIAPDGGKEVINVHTLALRLLEFQAQGLDPLAVFPLLLLIPLCHFSKPGIVDFTGNIVLVKPLKEHIQFLVTGQQPIQLPLFPHPGVFRCLGGAAHDGLDKGILIFAGKGGEAVHLIQHHPFQEVQPDIMGRRALSEPGVVVLATEKLDFVVALVEVEVEVAAALGAFQVAGEYAGLLSDLGPFAAGALGERLHLLPGGSLNDGLVDVEEDGPVFLRVFDPLFHLIGFGVAFEVDDVAAVLLQGEDLLDGGMAPFGGLHGTLAAGAIDAPAPPVIGGIDDTIRAQGGGNLRQPIAIQGHLVDAPHHGGGLRLDHPKAEIVRVLDVAVGRRGERDTGVALHLVDDPALFGDVLGVVLIEDGLFGKGIGKYEKT